MPKPYISALIKGSANDALRALERQLIPIGDAYALRSLHGGAETVLRLPYCYYQKVVDWYIADTYDEAPYPVGTLLFYTAEEAIA